MNAETVRALADSQLTQIIAWAQEELKARAEKRKQETIAKIKELAGSVGVSVTISGQRGRPAKGQRTLQLKPATAPREPDGAAPRDVKASALARSTG